MAGPVRGADVRLEWLTARIERGVNAEPAARVAELTEGLSVATGEAVTVRRLAGDGRMLVPVEVHHPDPVLRAAMVRAAAETTETSDSGLWRVLLEQDRAMVFPVPREGPPPPDASPTQLAFLARWPVRGVVGVPVRSGGMLVGGISLVRFVDPRPFTDEDVMLVERVAQWVSVPLAALGHGGD